MTKLVAILNLTPDSFSDGGKYNHPEAALRQLKNLLEEGADIIDIGAESTRPGATPLNASEEWERLKELLPLLISYIKDYNNHSRTDKTAVKISLDSRHPATIEKALGLGIDIINDVSGFNQEAMRKLAASSGKTIILMHNLGVPANRQITILESQDPIEIICSWAKNKILQLTDYGLGANQIILDPGLGFGKNFDQSIYIIRNIDKLRESNLPLLIGHSKKGFLEKIKGDNPLSKTLLLSAYLADKKVEYLRVHDVAKNKQAINNPLLTSLEF